MLTAKKLLIAARDKIADPTNWCQLYFARREDGMEVSSANLSASQWCAIGAMNLISFRETSTTDALVYEMESDRYLKKYGEAHNKAFMLLLDAADQVIQEWSPAFDEKILAKGSSITFVNDNLGHEHVMKMYDLAIRNAT